MIPLHRPGGHGAQGGATQRMVTPPAEPVSAEPVSAEPRWYQELADLLAFASRRLTGDYAVDEFGFDPDLADHVLLPLLRPLYRSWFRFEVTGIDHLPATGGALVVANHSGTLPLDTLMTAMAVHEEHPAGRHLGMLAGDLLFRIPVLGSLCRKSGQTLACVPDAERLLSSGELVGTWPEGYEGLGKRYRDRYKLQRFGRGCFVAAALRTQMMIIPCAIVGAEEIYPMIADLKPLAQLLGIPYFPVTPLFPLLGPLGMVPFGVQVVHRIRCAGPDRRLRSWCCRGYDAGVQPR